MQFFEAVEFVVPVNPVHESSTVRQSSQENLDSADLAVDGDHTTCAKTKKVSETRRGRPFQFVQ